ncbi:MAG: ABC transporter permease [Verrucomicrobia bacterium]|nr:ABC transporter permease [Verrucomicrobiota bacterium]
MFLESIEAAGESRTPIRRLFGGLGEAVWAQWDEVRHAAAVIGTVFCVCVQPRGWGRTVLKAFARQVLAIGVEPLWFVGAVAVFVGISVVVQLTFWVGEAGQSQLLGPLLVAVVARELGPLLINLVVIVRSGSAMTTELGVLKINGEVRVLEAQGNDPLLHLVMPRVLGMAVSTFCLTIIFVLVADVFNILAKSILPALFASVSCCIGGLGVGESDKEIPQATQRALTRSVAGLFVISAVVSLLTYL